MQTERYTAADEPCESWHNGNSGGSIPHQPLPFSRIAPYVEVGCDRCGKSLYTYKEAR